MKLNRYTLLTQPFHNDAMRRIQQERFRQVEALGYSLERDDAYVLGELADAASCYAMTIGSRAEVAADGTCNVPDVWPWKPVAFTESSTSDDGFVDGRLADLARAGALIVAEMERIMRAQFATARAENPDVMTSDEIHRVIRPMAMTLEQLRRAMDGVGAATASASRAIDLLTRKSDGSR